jgi:hypothetical protein
MSRGVRAERLKMKLKVLSNALVGRTVVWQKWRDGHMIYAFVLTYIPITKSNSYLRVNRFSIVGHNVTV